MVPVTKSATATLCPRKHECIAQDGLGAPLTFCENKLSGEEFGFADSRRPPALRPVAVAVIGKSNWTSDVGRSPGRSGSHVTLIALQFQ
jgi:hypothetical protein